MEIALFKKLVLILPVLQLGSGESLLLEKMAEIQGVVAFDEKKLATSLHTFVSPIAIY